MDASGKERDAAACAERTIALRDGRRLAYAEHGDARGRPLLMLHGFPGSRLEAALVHEQAARAGVRIVAPDRPGIGGSSPKRGRTLLDWAQDLLELADALGLERFPLVGVSGGAPYALACAFRAPERLSAVGLLCGLGPTDEPELLSGMLRWNRIGLRAARRCPALARPVLGAIAPLARRAPLLLVRKLARALPPPDRELLAERDLQRRLAVSFRESFRQGGAGPACDARNYARPWGFELSAIRARVHLWHGGRDAMVPQAMGLRMAELLPRCEPSFPPEEGHFSLVLRRCDEVFETLLA